MSQSFNWKDLTRNFSLYTYRMKEHLWFDCLAENIPIIRKEKPFADLLFTVDEPTLVVGAGPSMNDFDILDKAKRFTGKVVSTDRMLKPLLRLGIIPDYVVNVDSDPIIPSTFFQGKDHDLIKDAVKSHKTKLVLICFANPALVKFWPGERYWFFPVFEDNMLQPQPSLSRSLLIMLRQHATPIEAMGNVGMTSWEVAHYMSKGSHAPIYMVGVDYVDGASSKIIPQETDFWNGYLGQFKSMYRYAQVSEEWEDFRSVFGSLSREATEAELEAAADRWAREKAYLKVLSGAGEEVTTSLWWMNQRSTAIDALVRWAEKEYNEAIQGKASDKEARAHVIKTYNASPYSVLFPTVEEDPMRLDPVEYIKPELLSAI